MISDTNLEMLKLLADTLHDRKPNNISSNNWPEILKEMKSQAIYALPSKYISSFDIDDKDKEKYLLDVVNVRQNFYRLMNEQNFVLSALEEKGIEVVVLKGAAACINYKEPYNRSMGDIDLLVAPKDFNKAYDVLLSIGASSEYKIDDMIRHIGFKTKNNMEIELHRYFSSSDNKKQNSTFDEMLYKAIPSRNIEEFYSYKVPVLPPLENGLVLLGHINQHLSSGLGLRQIIDWLYFVEKYLDDDFWQNCFKEASEAIGMKSLAIITTAMAQKYLGLDKDIHWCKYEPVCDELMEYVLSHGNFGRKEKGINNKTTAVLKILRNPIHALTVAQKCGLNTFKACKKYHFLRPFAWCYQLGRWAVHGVKGGVELSTINKASSRAKREIELLKKLGVTRI